MLVARSATRSRFRLTRAAARASRDYFVMVGASSGLERELHLEQAARPRGVLQTRGCRLIRQVVDVREYAEVGRDLIGQAADDASLPIATYARVGIDDVDAGDHVLAVVPGAAAVAFTVHDRELAVHLVVLPLAVDPGAEVRGGGVAVAVERHGPLHAVVPQRLFPVEPRCVQQAELVGEVAAGGRPRGERVLEPQHLVPAAAPLEGTPHPPPEAP